MKKQPPAPGVSRNIDYPDIPLSRLGNGLSVLCVEAHHLPRISLITALPVGRVSNPESNLGLAQFTLETLKEGTASRASRKIAEQLDQLAIDYSTEMFLEHCLVSMTTLKSNLVAAADLFADILLNPIFPDSEIEKVKVRWHSHLLSERSDPSFLGNERVFQELFAGHPYSRISFTVDDLARLDREQATRFHEKRFTSQGSLVMFAGSIDLDDAVRQTEATLAHWTPGSEEKYSLPAAEPFEGPKICLVHRPHSVQTKVVVGLRTLPQNHPKFTDLQLMNQVLGGGASARLFLNLREERGFTYGVYSSVRGYSQDGIQLISCSVRSDKTGETLSEILREMKEIQDKPPEPEELSRCKSEIIGNFVRRMETPASIGSMELSRRLKRLPPDHYRSFIPRINSVTSQQVVEVARRLLTPDRAAIAVVGDRSEVEEQLKPFGEVGVYDTDGQQIG